jgi:L-iditol 2-dehydrogenase
MSAEMHAVVLHGRQDARLERVPVPPVGTGEVRIRIRAALTCGTDLKVFLRGYHARMIVPPAVFGHELAGVVDAVGPGVEEWRPGDRVVAANSAPCGSCFYCHGDREELCDYLLFLNGAYAEYVTVPERVVRKNLLRIPDSVPFEVAALTEPLACALHAIEQTGVRMGETVAIVGAGPLGLLLTRCAVLEGARVLVLGRRPERLEAARAMGSTGTFDVSGEGALAWIRERTAGRGADRVIEAAGNPEAWEQAIALARRGGTVNLFGGCAGGTRISVDTARLHYEALTLLGTFHHTPRFIQAALDLLAQGAVPAATLIQERISLDRLPERLPGLAAGGGPLKVAVLP